MAVTNLRRLSLLLLGLSPFLFGLSLLPLGLALVFLRAIGVELVTHCSSKIRLRAR